MYGPDSLLTSSAHGTAERWALALALGGADLPGTIAAFYFRDAPLAGLNADLALAQAVHETGWFRSVAWLERRNPAGIGMTDPATPGRQYSTPEVGIRAHLAHLCCYVYSTAECPIADFNTDPVHGKLRWWEPRHHFHDGRSALADLIRPERSWAVPGTGYVDAIVRIANEVVGEWTVSPIVALAAGHHNSQGGHAVEIRVVGELIGSYEQAFGAAGFTTHVLTPTTGDIASIGRRAVELGANLLIELHTEAGPRGVFVIYPDWGDDVWGLDVDADVRDTLGPAIASAISQASGLPVRASGPVLSERQTAVGTGGSRLALFGATAGARATMTRMLIEHGAHTQPADLAIVVQPAKQQTIATATARACAEFYGRPAPAPPAYHVGAGILAVMAARGDSPVGPEEYLHRRIDGADIISVAPGRLGQYWYHPAAGRVAFTAWEGGA